MPATQTGMPVNATTLRRYLARNKVSHTIEQINTHGAASMVLFAVDYAGPRYLDDPGFAVACQTAMDAAEHAARKLRWAWTDGIDRVTYWSRVVQVTRYDADRFRPCPAMPAEFTAAIEPPRVDVLLGVDPELVQTQDLLERCWQRTVHQVLHSTNGRFPDWRGRTDTRPIEQTLLRSPWAVMASSLDHPQLRKVYATAEARTLVMDVLTRS